MESKGSESNTGVHIVMFPWFAFGHINPFIELSNKLTNHGFKISFISIPGNIPKIKSSLILSPQNQVIPVSIPPVEGLSPDFDSSSDITPETSELLKVALDQMQPQIKTLLSQLKPQFVLFDFAHHWIPPLASQLGIKSAHFSIFPAVSDAYLMVPSRMNNLKQQPPTLEDLKKPPLGFPKTSIIGSRTFEAQNFLYVFKSFHGGPTLFERVMGYVKTCDVMIKRSCSEMEGPYIDYLTTQLGKPILLAGPNVPEPPSGVLEEKWATWLGQFPENSVIFCNFGSEARSSIAQIEQLALGLELTGMPFFLVLKLETSSEDFLPKGFKERVKNRGIVHTGWVQQQHILAHKSVGCFLGHSGISSVIEGIVNNCQLVFVPQFGDQIMNSKLLSGDLRVGVEVNRRDEDGYYGKEDILEAVKIVTVDGDKEPGKSIRGNLKKWKEFLLDKEKQEKYITDLANELKALALKA